MRLFLAIALLMGTSVCVNAQNRSTQSLMSLVASSEVKSLSKSVATNEDFPLTYGVQREQYRIPKVPGERRMKVGKILMGLGTVSVISGILVYNNRDPNYYTHGSYGNTYGDDPHVAGGQLLVAIGVGLIVPGAMVYIHGAHQYHKYKEKNPQALYIPAGKLGLGYRF